MTENCDNCCYWDMEGWYTILHASFGQQHADTHPCRRYPSAVKKYKNNWCGEWKPSPTIGEEKSQAWPSFIPKAKLIPEPKAKREKEYGYIEGPNDHIPFSDPLPSNPSDVWQDEDRTSTGVERVMDTRIDYSTGPGGARLVA